MKNLFLSIFCTINFFVFSQELDYTKIPQIQTKASFTTEVEPNLITLSITLSESNSKGKDSVEEMEKRKKIFLPLKFNLWVK